MKKQKYWQQALILFTLVVLVSFPFTVSAEETPPAVPPESVIVTDDLASFDDLSGSGDIDLPNARALAIRWNFGATTAVDFHVYVLDDQVGKLEYLGRTGDGVTSYLLWEESAKNLAPSYRKGPQSGHSYLFYVFALTGNPAKPVEGPLAAAGPVLFRTSASGGETPAPEIPVNTVIITDDIDSYEDLSNGQDTDPKNKRELVIRWNFGDVKAKDFHIYVVGDTLLPIQYLGRTGNGNTNLFRWRENSHFLAQVFHPGPQPGHAYRFFVFAITDKANKPVIGPITNAGPVQFFVTEEEESTPGEIPANTVIVTDDLDSTDDLSNKEDIDPPGKRQLVIQWNFPDADAKDFHVYVLANDEGKAKYLGRTGSGMQNYFDWQEGTKFVAGEFKKGPQPNNSYRFYVFILHERGPKAVSGPFAAKGPVLFKVEEIPVTPTPEPTVTPTPTPEPPEEMECVVPGDYYDEKEIGISPVLLGEVQLTGAVVETNSGEETILLDVIDCSGDEGLDVFILWSEASAKEKAKIIFNDDLCEGKGPRTAVVTMSSEEKTTFTALDEDGKVVDKQKSKGYTPENTLITAPVSIRLTDNTTPMEQITLVSGMGKKGIRTIEIEGSDVCILKICWSCKEVEPGPTPTPKPTPSMEVYVEDYLDAGEDLSNEKDQDPQDARQLVVRWNLEEMDVKDFHIYVLVDNEGKPQYLGRTGSADADSFVWDNQNKLVAGIYKQGPQFGHLYQFYVYVLKTKGPKAFTGPYTHAGPVWFEEELPADNGGSVNPPGDDDGTNDPTNGNDDNNNNGDGGNNENLTDGPIEVAVDIKPRVCPNNVSTNDKGTLAVAIMGTDTFDVNSIDPESVILEDVEPRSWVIGDVGAPNDPGLQVTGCEACNTKKPDKIPDLVFYFDAEKVIDALGKVKQSDCVKLVLHGKLAGENGAEIQGVDYISISNKGTVIIGKK
ncbi:MAG: hypothetical protein HPY51_17270 [Candidatus Omnitrophica bacterium]|nr:hypothetical protein [Candidatus Omnitrophota bacterium]